MSATILVIDDDPDMRGLLQDVLVREGYEVTQAQGGAEALLKLRAESFAAIIIDKNMPGLSGLDVLPGIRKMYPETPVILITAFGDAATYLEAMEKGAFEYINKPFKISELMSILRRALPPPPRAFSGPGQTA